MTAAPFLSLPAAPSQSVASATGTAPAPAERVVWSYDFEDGQIPRILTTGALVAGPPREGSHFCAIGGLSPWALDRNVVALTGPSDGLLSYNRNRVLSFDYWIGVEANHLLVQTKNRDRGQNYAVDVRNIVRGAWGRMVLRLADFQPRQFDDRAMEEGDILLDILIVGGTLAVAPLYIDNVAVIEYPGGTMPPSTGRP
jgi:hypothetical protein